MQQWASAPPGAPPAAAEQEKARRESEGVLKERSSKIPRAEGGLNALLTRYLDKTIGQYEKQKGVPEPMQKILSKMEWVVVHVLGREKDDTPGAAGPSATTADAGPSGSNPQDGADDGPPSKRTRSRTRSQPPQA